ncbi:hypothetical protein XaC1_193 [Xanthomonas phage XaC1]|nr:hypothetical protein XaC1_193 [Xanthomonas phage XaC1]
MKEFLIGLVLLVISGLSTLAYNYYTAPLKGNVQERQLIESGSNRIEQYESYFNQCVAIQGYEGSIDVQKDLLKSETDKENIQHIKTVIAGISAQRVRAIAQYNADVVKLTKSKYIDTSLPNYINTEGKTKCVN